MIHLIEGRSGSGKTAYLYDIIGKLAQNGGEKLLYLIPEQSSFECEKDFLRMLGARLARNVRVMSFTRLYHMVMSETGGFPGTPIDDGARKIIMSCTLEDCADALQVYSGQALKLPFSDVASGAVKEIKQCGIKTELLRKKAKNIGSRELRAKIDDLALISDLFTANVELSGVDPYDNDMRLEKRIAETSFFDGYTIAVDDFSGFTAQQQKIINLMMAQADDFYISLCMDSRDKSDLFFTVKRTRAKLLEAAQLDSLKVASPVRLNENRRTISLPLQYLEENLYRQGDIEDAPEFTDEEVREDVAVAEAADIYEECDYIAGRVCELALSGKCRWRDIAVVFRSAQSYSGVLDAAFERYGIPYFMSKPQPVDGKPLMRLAVSALEYALSQNDESKLLAAVKTGLFGISAYSAAQLENYIFVWSVKGRQMFSEFTQNPGGYSDQFTDADMQLLEEINETRRRVAEPFALFIRELKSDDGFYTAREISQALYDFMISAGVPELLKMRAQRKIEFCDEALRLWDMLCELLNKMHASFADRRITLKRYTELFKAVLRGEDIADIPQTLDQVLVGTADSIRLSKPYAVFIAGALEGEFPRQPVPDGVFSDAERRRLISMELPFYDAVTELFLQEKFFVYNAVSAPTNKLFVTYPKGGLTGGESQPSTIVSEILRIFPAITVTDSASIGELERVVNDRTAFELYAKNYRRNDAFTAALGIYLGETTDYEDRLSSLGADIKNLDARVGSSQLTAAIFGRNKRLSASQIENFYQCRFKYFCKYGLNLRDRRKAQLDALVYGNILHYILENIIIEYKNRGFAPFTDDELKELINRLLDRYIKESLGGEEDKSKRFMHLYRRSEKRIMRVIGHMLEELSQSQFKPVDAELEISRSGKGIDEWTLETDSGSVVSVNGKIDRVDIMKTESGGSVRVIDYKSNGKEFRLSEVVNGLNLQMLIYLMAVAKNGEERYNMNLEPAAVLYMRSDAGSVTIDDPGAGEGDVGKSVNKKTDETLRLTGMSLDDDAVINGMDSGGKERFVKASAVTKNQLSMIFDIVEDKLRKMSGELDEGKIGAVPVSKKGSRGMICGWCEFNDVCRRENADRANMIADEKDSEVIARLEAEREGKGENSDE